MKKVYTFHSDSGHGWLRVPMSAVRFVGVVDKITGYSYQSKDGKTAYLEEDIDAGTFLEALKPFVSNPVLKSVDDGERSPIRGYPSFDGGKTTYPTRHYRKRAV